MGVGIRLVAVDPRVSASWSEVLSHAKHIRASRRSSRAEDDRSGLTLVERMTKCNTDVYEKDREMPYVPFVAERIKELAANSPVVWLLSRLPGQVAEAIKSPAQILRRLSDEEGTLAFSLYLLMI